ncbi:MAG: uroporphyrinogen decarboxylase family protein [Verrucomicrobiota bacterium]
MDGWERVKRAIEFQGPDQLPVAGNCMRYAAHGDVVYHFPNMRGVVWWLGDGNGVDEWGCRWISARSGDMGQIREHPLKALNQFAQGLRPDGTDAFRYEPLLSELPDRPDAYHVYCNGPCLFERMHFLRGFDTLLMDMATDPDGFKLFAEWVVQYQEQTIAYLAAHFKGRVHAVRCTDDLGTQLNTIMSPTHFRELLKPYYARVADLCHRHGLHFWLHSCGKIDGLLDDLIDAGLDVINMLQPRIFDLPELGRRFAGRIAFENYPDMQLSVPTGNRQIICQDIAAQLKYLATPQGGYIAAWMEPRYLKSECDILDETMSDYITRTYRELDPYCQPGT